MCHELNNADIVQLAEHVIKRESLFRGSYSKLLSAIQDVVQGSSPCVGAMGRIQQNKF